MQPNLFILIGFWKWIC